MGRRSALRGFWSRWNSGRGSICNATSSIAPTGMATPKPSNARRRGWRRPGGCWIKQRRPPMRLPELHPLVWRAGAAGRHRGGAGTRPGGRPPCRRRGLTPGHRCGTWTRSAAWPISNYREVSSTLHVTTPSTAPRLHRHPPQPSPADLLDRVGRQRDQPGRRNTRLSQLPPL